MKKYVIVTSEITYTPTNYADFLYEFINNVKTPPHAIVFLENRSLILLFKAVFLILIGAKRIGLTLLRNYFTSFSDKRRTLILDQDISLIYEKDLNSSSFIDWIKKEEIELIINARTRCIYKRELLNATSLGSINIHHGLLPDARGTMCDLHALFEGRDAGFTIHQMNEKIDDGALLLKQITTPSSLDERSYLSHLKRSGKIEGETLANFLNETYLRNTAPIPLPNISEKKRYYRNPTAAMISEMIKKGIKL